MVSYLPSLFSLWSLHHSIIRVLFITSNNWFCIYCIFELPPALYSEELSSSVFGSRNLFRLRLAAISLASDIVESRDQMTLVSVLSSRLCSILCWKIQNHNICSLFPHPINLCSSLFSVSYSWIYSNASLVFQNCIADQLWTIVKNAVLKTNKTDWNICGSELWFWSIILSSDFFRCSEYARKMIQCTNI